MTPLKPRHNPLFLILIASTFMFSAACKTEVVKEVKVKESEPLPLATPAENMVSVSTGRGVFYIDRYEVSEPVQGDFFSVPNQQPKTNVTQSEAKQICESLGKRLCTSREWELACVGGHFLKYSYSHKNIPGFCNIGGIRTNTAYTGEYSHCKSDTGVHDLIGNVMELTSDVSAAGLVIAKGGDYSAKDATCFQEFFDQPTEKNAKLGFRCCK